MGKIKPDSYLAYTHKVCNIYIYIHATYHFDMHLQIDQAKILKATPTKRET